ncbi:lipid-transfer protein [Pseudonocardia acaciae]|uniref:lipid-transfer protein n=1 Tax=Pseudonocardia acaciae TaxID=551276 RepID=UPI001B8041DF|nr:lipid-transfer protein [Pseudonocardia acaciae]
MNRVYVVGVGMTKFEKPGRREGRGHPEMAREAGCRALADAGINYGEVDQAYVGYVHGESTSGQRAVYELGMTGIPVINVNNNCATGSTALYLAAEAIRGGRVRCVLALGFEMTRPGPAVPDRGEDRTGPIATHVRALPPEALCPPAPWMFGAAGREHMERHGSTPEHFAKIGEKNHRHSAHNPYARCQRDYTLEEVMSARTVYHPLTALQCAPASDGSAAAILASEAFVDVHGLADRAVEIVGQAMTTDFDSTFDGSAKNIIGYDMNWRAARRVYAQSGLGPEDFQVIELHDCFSASELLLYESLGLCREGEAGSLVDAGDTTYGGRWVVNPSGGLIGRGHPLGATGLAQCAELAWQLRGAAGRRQVTGASAALQHNIGLGGAAVVTAYRAVTRNESGA